MDKPKFNFIDALLILLIAAIIAVGVSFAASRRTGGKSNSDAAVTVEYRVQFTQAQPSLGELFRAAAENGETVWVSEKERAEATLVSAEVTPAQKINTDSENERIIIAESPDLCDITVTLRSSGSENERQITAGSVPLHVGEEVSVKGKGIAGYGYIIDMKKVD